MYVCAPKKQEVRCCASTLCRPSVLTSAKTPKTKSKYAGRTTGSTTRAMCTSAMSNLFAAIFFLASYNYAQVL